MIVNSSENANSLNSIKDMLAGLPQFQQGKEAYSLHLSMAQECMTIFQQRKLADIASVEQVSLPARCRRGVNATQWNCLMPTGTCVWAYIFSLSLQALMKITGNRRTSLIKSFVCLMTQV